MNINIDTLVEKTGVDIKGIVHVGACLGEEAPYYRKYTENVIWVEANKELIPKIKQAVGRNNVYNLAVCDKDFETRKFNIIYSLDKTNPGCSSLFNLKKHSEYYPMIVKEREEYVTTIKLDTLIKPFGYHNFNFLNLDIQGAELLALKGAKKYLEYVDLVYTEFSLEELYEGCCLLWQLDDYLRDFGFVRTELSRPHNSWGDCLYEKLIRKVGN